MLENVKSSKEPRLARDLWYGRPKVGKSTLASKMPAPLFISLDDGVAHLDVPLYPGPLATYQDLMAAISVVRKEPHKYKTLVIDGIDVAERLIAAEVCKSFVGKNGAKFKTIAEIPYRDGYAVAIDQCWRPLLSELRFLQVERKMHIILTGWAIHSKDSDTEGEKARRWQPMLYADQRTNTAEQIAGWAENVLFLTIDETVLRRETADPGSKGLSAGKITVTTDENGQAKRLIKTGPDGGWIAGNRWSMPPEIDCTIEAYSKYAKETK